MKDQGVNFGLDSPTTPAPIVKDCFRIPIPCKLLSRDEPSLPPVLSLLYEFQEDDDEISDDGGGINYMDYNFVNQTKTQKLENNTTHGNITNGLAPELLSEQC